MRKRNSKGQFTKITAIKKGDRYNRLTAIKFSHRDKNHYQCWLFKCECGNTKVAKVSIVKNGLLKSCGCLVKENKFNLTHGMARTRTYYVWANIKDRCLNPKNPRYKDYGGRGIIVCPEWMKFKNFFADMGKKPEGLSIDRIDNDKNYCESNCKWSTPKEQANNRRNNLI